jgi:hypothetical protein
MSRSSRRAKIERRRAAALHPMREDLERIFAEIDRPRYGHTTGEMIVAPEPPQRIKSGHP